MKLIRKHDFRSCIRTAAPLAGVLFVGLLVLVVLFVVQEIVPAYGKADQSSNEPPVNTLKIKVQQCSSAADIQQKITLEGPSCPVEYPPITVQDVLAGISKPYTFGGIDRLGCKACSQKGLWPRFCLFRKTGVKFWDDVNCNVREEFGREAVLKSVQFSSNLTLNWPGSSGMSSVLSQQAAAAGRNSSSARLASVAQTLAPGPVEITPCHVWRIIRGRTLWIIGDSQMKSVYVAFKCFMLEFWLDFKQYRPTWNSTINNYLASSLTVDTEPACIHMRDSTRICQLVVTSAGAMVRGPAGPNGTTAGDSIWQLLQKQLASPDDIFAMNFGLWYKSWTPAAKDFYRHHLNALGAYYKQTGASFPNVFFLETVKLHYPYPAGEQDSVIKNTTRCAAAANVDFNFSDSSLRYNQSKLGQVSAGAIDKAKEFMQFQRPKNASASRQRRRLAGENPPLPPQQQWQQQQQQQQWQQQQQQQWQQGAGNVSSDVGSNSSSNNRTELQGFNSSSSNSSNSSSSSRQLPTGSSTVNPANNSSRNSTAVTSRNTSPQSKKAEHRLGSSSNSSSSSSRANSTNTNSGYGGTRKSSSENNSLAAAAAQPDLNPSNLTPEIAATGPASQPKTQQVKTSAPQTLGGADMEPPVLAPEAAAALVLAGTWRNDIAREVLRDKWGMPWVPIYNTTVPAYWGHRNQPDNPDCIHYCNPGVPQTIMSQLMLAVAMQVQPLEGQAVPDKTCLWGTEQVYDEHEELFAKTNSD